MNNKTPILVQVIASLLAGALGAALFAALPSWANDDDNPATDAVPRAFSYQGNLEWDGIPVTGATLMTFSLFGAPDAGTAKWTETRTVEVFNGRFGAELGADPTNPIQSAVFDAGPLYLGIDVQRLDESLNPEGEPVNLGNRQRINPVPYALWSTQSTNLNVANDLQVSGAATFANNVRVNGTTQVAGLNVAGSSDFTGDANVRGQLQSNNRVGGNAFDEYSDYSYLLYRNTTPRSSYGIGIESGTLAFHTQDVTRFYRSGSSVLTLDQNVSVQSALFTPLIRIQGQRTVATAVDADGSTGYGAGYNQTWADCGQAPVMAVRLRQSPVSNQMIIEAVCAP